jgi:hypothetical protein
MMLSMMELLTSMMEKTKMVKKKRKLMMMMLMTMMLKRCCLPPLHIPRGRGTMMMKLMRTMKMKQHSQSHPRSTIDHTPL